jgi:hypothetical protein
MFKFFRMRAFLVVGLLLVFVTVKSQTVISPLTSGFQIAKAPGPTPPLATDTSSLEVNKTYLLLTKPATPSLQNGLNPGELISSVKAVAGAVSYLHQYATEAEMAQGKWNSVASSKSSCLLTALTSGTRYYCRIAAIGSKDQIVYSAVVDRIAA